jgi:hypothetical protein
MPQVIVYEANKSVESATPYNVHIQIKWKELENLMELEG